MGANAEVSDVNFGLSLHLHPYERCKKKNVTLHQILMAAELPLILV